MFTQGETVKLKSGGPVMTVKQAVPGTHDEDPDSVHCVWFNENVVAELLFPSDCLIRVLENEL